MIPVTDETGITFSPFNENILAEIKLEMNNKQFFGQKIEWDKITILNFDQLSSRLLDILTFPLKAYRKTEKAILQSA